MSAVSSCTIPFEPVRSQEPASRSQENQEPTEQERLIFRWAKFEGMKQVEIARQLNINQSTVSRAIQRYERWIAAGGQEAEALPREGCLRAQRWLTFERNEWILSAALRIAAEMERQLETAKSLVTGSGMTPDTTREIRTEHKVIDRSGIAARFLRLAWRINMDQLRMAEEQKQVTNEQVPLNQVPMTNGRSSEYAGSA